MIGLFAMVAFFAVLFVGIVLRNRLGRLTTVTLLPHQRGVLFRKGRPIRDVGPGSYRVWAGRDLIVHGDVRPISVNYENQVVALADRTPLLYGFSASAQVRDIRKAMYRARDYTQIPAAILLRCTRRQLHLSSSSALKMDKEAIVKRIGQKAKEKLEASGFELLSFHLPQLLIGAAERRAEPTTRA